jgi:hypothetical protein
MVVIDLPKGHGHGHGKIMGVVETSSQAGRLTINTCKGLQMATTA